MGILKTAVLFVLAAAAEIGGADVTPQLWDMTPHQR
ncbi:hypothetical protein J2W20_002988 [Sinomonas atrocyanea]|nr:hypothetical protein [Sinomonas atrocyanea]